MMRYAIIRMLTMLLIPFFGFLAAGCKGTDEPRAQDIDVQSFALPDEVVVTHIDLDISVDFENRRIAGRATLHLENKTEARHVVLDTRDLSIDRITLDDTDVETKYDLGKPVEFLGQPLTVSLLPETEKINIYYRTDPGALALQWLEPEQTTGGVHPFLFTQSQAILARTWVPCQDSPGIRITYSARVSVPLGLLAVMSAQNGTTKTPDGIYSFHMPQPIPAYLLALAVGDIEFRAIGPRSGVYAEPSVLQKAAWEFGDLEKMIDISESLYGPYRWTRYDIIVLPPSFPFGGMENPRLTFATPTILAGDRSLVSLVAHELAHSWSGNLVTNATWDDFWLNEGFTSYIENRIMEKLYGKDYADMLALLSYQELIAEIAGMGENSPDTRLHLDLEGRDPDDGMTSIAYDKGAIFLNMIEKQVGRERWDSFLRQYFDAFAFETMTSERFLAYLREHLIGQDRELESLLRLDEWVYSTGLPDNCPVFESTEFTKVEEQLRHWSEGKPATALNTNQWTTHHWLHFLKQLPSEAAVEQLAELDAAFGFTATGNPEILTVWLLHCIDHRYEAAYPALESFLTGMGRRKFLVPLYSRLAETGEGKRYALEIYERARSTYHPISYGTIDALLEWTPPPSSP